MPTEDPMHRLLRLCREVGLPEVIEGISYNNPELDTRKNPRGLDGVVIH